jgi:hypothetical protein
MQKLVHDAQDGDHFCFLYSGHGAQVKSRTNSEPDGLDEVVVAADDDGSYNRVVRDNVCRFLVHLSFGT